MKSANNNSTKAALAALSVASVVGGWAALGFGDESQGSDGQSWVGDTNESQILSQAATNQAAMPETLPVTTLLDSGTASLTQVPDLTLAPIPEVVKPAQRLKLDLAPLPASESQKPATGATAATLKAGASQSSNASVVKKPALPPLPTLSPLPTLPASSSGAGQIHSLPSPTTPPATAQPQKPAPAVKPAIRTKSSR